MHGPIEEWCFYWTVQRNHYYERYIESFNINDSPMFIEYYLFMISVCDKKLDELPCEIYLSEDEINYMKKKIFDILCKPEEAPIVIKQAGDIKKSIGLKRSRSFIVTENNNKKIKF